MKTSWIESLAVRWFHATGWKLEGEFPKDQKKFVVLFGPHTSFWDFYVGVPARALTGLKIDFLIKKDLFFWPLGSFLKKTGGHPVDRSKKNNLTDQVVEMFQTHEEFRMAITPEGTRSKVSKWKTGFYRICMRAGIPMIPVGLDFATKRVIIDEPFYPSGDMEQDMTVLKDFYRPLQGKHPEKGVE
ncbi:1-acyl-sn-glycerol-3-phosphate acyltransferase [Algivirga pacifica]|uniref:Lysophospholipid acyltransferase family protein n=1 Tax=Algivirga pacifica TaxID=1162670 RepID=A0ABP9CYM5_9BACT